MRRVSTRLDLITGYTHREERPLIAYAGLVSLFTALFSGMLALAKRTGRPIPDRLPWSDILLLGIATHKLSRLVAKDTVTSFLRAPFTRFEGTAGASEVQEQVRGKGLQHALGELLTCPFCLGPWIAATLSSGLIFAPRVTRLIASIGVMLTLADFLQIAYEGARKQAELAQSGE